MNRARVFVQEMFGHNERHRGVWRVWRLRSSYRRQFNASMFFFTYLHSSLQLQIIKHQHMYQYVSIFQHLAAQNQHIQSLQTIKNGLKPRYTWSILKYDLWTCHILFPSFSHPRYPKSFAMGTDGAVPCDTTTMQTAIPADGQHLGSLFQWGNIWKHHVVDFWIYDIGNIYIYIIIYNI